MNRRTKIAATVLAGSLILFATTASSCGNDQGNEARTDKTSTSNFAAQAKNDPVPNLNDSLERANIVEHLKRNNQPDRVRYIYLLADTGGIYALLRHQGEGVFDRVAAHPDRRDRRPVRGRRGDAGADRRRVVRRRRGGGIYFFTDAGVEVQWNGRWLLTDAPMQIKSPTLTLAEK